MEFSSSFFCLMYFNILIMLLSPSLLVYPQKAAFSSMCHDHEKSALLQFKQSFVIDKSASEYVSSYPKVSSWNTSKDCCMWDGIDCDEHTGHVIGLDLSSSLLFGFINSSSSLFHLVHLRSLNLADNHFNFSQIPTGLVHLPKLTYLNLFDSVFFGEVPKEISHLSMLSSLNLSKNSMTMNGSNFKSLIHNLTNIKQLGLGHVNMSAVTITPEILANLSSSLTTLDLAYCELYGESFGRVFNLPKLQYLDLSHNYHLRGYLPEFHSNNTFTHLRLAATSIFGSLPASVGKLSQLVELDLSYCTNLSGHIPSTISNLSQLSVLDLSGCNNLNGHIFSIVGNLNQLSVLDLSGCNNLSGHIPSTIGEFSQLIILRLSSSNLSGHIPSSIGNLSLLTTLDLSFNNLEGQIPSSFYQLMNLESLDLSDNRLSVVDLEMFLLLKNLSYLSLSYNNLSVISSSTSPNTNTTIAQLNSLYLDSCKLTKLPDFLRNQTKLFELFLYNDSIRGSIPVWIFNNTSLEELDLSYNSLTGFDQSADLFNPHSKLQSIYLSNNKLKGSLPIPSPSILYYFVSNNALEGEIPPLFCNLTSLAYLYLSNNSLSGKIPPCLVNLSTSLSILKLEGNHFGGTIPDIGTNGCSIWAMILSGNQLKGELPRSMANCTQLEILDVGNNQINDTFPFWLEILPHLKVLVLHFNKFNGVIRDSGHQNKSRAIFPKLHIVDLSHNSFSGRLPSDYFQKWDAMKVFGELVYSYRIGITITNKGTAREYLYIQNVLNLLDLSNNRFEGEIPELIGNLKGLNSLYLSNNLLTGHIPSSLGDLSKLEVLDLSWNKLSGQIPQQLTLLNFLEIFSVAHNNLKGPIPHGKQFDTFLDSSYEGNAGLCGKPLSEECGDPKDLQPPSLSTVEGEEEKVSALEFGWKPVVMGYSCGLVIGIVIGHFVINRRYNWFVYTFGITLPKYRVKS